VEGSRDKPLRAVVSAATSGDKDAFGKLVERYQDMVCAIAYSGTGNLEAAHDVAQDAFLASFEKLSLLRSPAKFGGWLARITRRLCSKWNRSENYRRALARSLRGTLEMQEGSTPESILVTKERNATVQRVVRRLPERLREVVILHYFVGKSHAEIAADLGVNRAAVAKRAERAKVRIREYLTTEIEVGLRMVQPDARFKSRLLAALPTGSICGKLGLSVTKVGIADALRELAQAVAEHAPTLITGGVVVTSKKTIATLIALLLLVAGGTGYVVVRARQGGSGQAAESVSDYSATAPTESLAKDGNNRLSRTVPSGQLSVQQINDLILEGSPELDEMDVETRSDLLRHLLRDTLERKLSLDLIKQEYDMASELLEAGKYMEALPIFLAIYDVASSPENMGRLNRQGTFASSQEGMCWGLAPFMRNSAFRVLEAATRAGLKWDRDEWASRVAADADELLEGPAAGAERALLMAYKPHFDYLLRGIKLSNFPEEANRAEEAAREYLEEYLKQENLTPQERWSASFMLATAYQEVGRYDAALAICERLEEDAEWYEYSGGPKYAEYPGGAIKYLSDKLKEQRAVATLPPAEQGKIKESKDNLAAIRVTLESYAREHDGAFPTNASEVAKLVDSHGAQWVDPFTGQPYEYVCGLGQSRGPYEVIVRTQTRNGLSVQLSAGGDLVVKAEE